MGSYRPAYDADDMPDGGLGGEEVAGTVVRSFWRAIGWGLGRAVVSALLGRRR